MDGHNEDGSGIRNRQILHVHTLAVRLPCGWRRIHRSGALGLDILRKTGDRDERGADKESGRQESSCYHGTKMVRPPGCIVNCDSVDLDLVGSDVLSLDVRVRFLQNEPEILVGKEIEPLFVADPSIVVDFRAVNSNGLPLNLG